MNQPLHIFVPLALMAVVATADLAADEVLAVLDVDRVVVQYQRVPVVLGLAYVGVPEHPDAHAAALARLTELAADARVRVVYQPEFGTDQEGGARVMLNTSDGSLNEQLLSEGLVPFVAGVGEEPRYARRAQRAETEAKRAKLGVWAEGAPAVVASADAPAASEPEQRQRGSSNRRERASSNAAFVAELNSDTYYPIDAPEVASINPRRRIEYATEAEARRAGKRPAVRASAARGGGLDAAAEAVERGRTLLGQAMEAGNTPRRDQLYQEALADLSAAVQIYAEHLEQNENDEAIGERLREAMQMRYSAMKNRRA